MQLCVTCSNKLINLRYERIPFHVFGRPPTLLRQQTLVKIIHNSPLARIKRNTLDLYAREFTFNNVLIFLAICTGTMHLLERRQQ